ncbi:MAG: hypothetical protein AAGF23_03085 [Acidobacteriota bacterium]
MDIATKRRVVRIVAAFADGTPKVSTGVRIKPGWILACQHGLERPETGERAAKVHAFLAAPDGGVPPQAECRVAWRGEERLDPNDLLAVDAALLKESELPEITDGELLLVEEHLAGADFETAGWLGVSEMSQNRIAPEEDRGKFHAIDEAATLLPLELAGVEPRSKNPKTPPRGGLSGAPVFVTSGPGAGKLYGLVRKAPESRPDHVWAVASPALLRNAKFREHLGIQSPPPAEERLLLELRRLLSEEPHLGAKIAATRSDWQDAWASDPAGGPDGLIAELARVDEFKALIELLHGLSVDTRDQAHFREISSYVAALGVDRTLRRSGVDVSKTGSGWVVEVAGIFVCEVALAAKHGRKPLFRYEAKDNYGPAPALRQPAPPLEAGISSKRWAEEQVQEIAANYLRHDLAQRRFMEGNEWEIFQSADPNQQKELLEDVIQAYCRDVKRREGRAPYVLTAGMRSKTSEHNVIQFLKELKVLLPDVESVDQRGNAKEGSRFDRALRPLFEILGLRNGESR